MSSDGTLLGSILASFTTFPLPEHISINLFGSESAACLSYPRFLVRASEVSHIHWELLLPTSAPCQASLAKSRGYVMSNRLCLQGSQSHDQNQNQTYLLLQDTVWGAVGAGWPNGVWCDRGQKMCLSPHRLWPFDLCAPPAHTVSSQ